jgi:hypothetical protein
VSESRTDGVVVPLRRRAGELQALRLENAQLRRALRTRIIIEQAKGGGRLDV